MTDKDTLLKNAAKNKIQAFVEYERVKSLYNSKEATAEELRSAQYNYINACNQFEALITASTEEALL